MMSQEFLQGHIDVLKENEEFTTPLVWDTPAADPEDPSEVDPQPPSTSTTTAVQPPSTTTEEEEVHSPSPKRRKSSRVAGKKAPKKKPPPPPKTWKQEEEEWRKSGAMKGKVPPYLSSLEYVPPDLLYGFTSQAPLTRLKQYLSQNGQWVLRPTPADGACMFTSIIMGIDAELEYTQIHLRRDMLLLLCEDPDYFFPLIKHHIQEDYGKPKKPASYYLEKELAGELTIEERRERDKPGPLSLVSWMEHMMKGDSWGDAVCLHLISCLFNCPMTVINAERLNIIQYRNTFSINDQEILLIYVNADHYMGAGQFIFEIVLPKINFREPFGYRTVWFGDRILPFGNRT